MRKVLIGLVLAAGASAAYYGQPLVHENADAVLVIVTVMTVFAGFLVAIITILGDPAMIPEGSWRTAEARREGLESRLIVHTWLFSLYLIAIGLLFVGVLLNKAPESVISHEWRIWVERLYLFFATASFLFTLSLPRALWKLQLARLDAETERRRKKVHLKD